MAFVGGTDVPELVVVDYGPDTEVTLSIAGLNGETLTPTPVSTDDGQTWYATPVYTAAGKWVAHWVVTGSGANETYQDLWVSRVPTAAQTVEWRPELWNVAAYIPRRTLVGAIDGSGAPRRTFDGDTMPTAGEVQLLITGACAWVTLTTGTPDETLWPAALDCAAMRAAALVEQAYPENSDDVSTADALFKQAAEMRKDLAAANIALIGDDPGTSDDNLLPMFSFPAAPAWSDLDL